MELPPLVDGHIIARYKRFFADVELPGGEVVTAHCPNTGTMESCWRRGAPVQVSRSDNPRRKLAYTLERIDMGGGWIGVNTLRVNGIVSEGIAAGRVAPLAGYDDIAREPRFGGAAGGRSRFDLRLTGAPGECLVEIKNATLLRDGVIQFPDAVTSRGLKHLDLLAEAQSQGFRACLVFAMNRPESDVFRPAADTDPAYAARLRQVMAQGVEVITVRMRHGDRSIDAGEGSHWTPASGDSASS